jgi:hypothetical protein
MNAPATTALTLDPFDGSFDPTAQGSYSEDLTRQPAASSLPRLGAAICVMALAPFLMATMSALALIFLARLVFAFVTVGFEK